MRPEFNKDSLWNTQADYDRDKQEYLLNYLGGMKSCFCKHTEEIMFENCKKCTNEKSVYYGKIVDKRNLCRECEELERRID